MFRETIGFQNQTGWKVSDWADTCKYIRAGFKWFYKELPLTNGLRK